MMRILIIILLIIFVSCVRQGRNHDSNESDKNISVYADRIKPMSINTNTIFDSIPLENLPFKDTIHDWKNKNYKKISKQNIEFLGLEKISMIRQDGADCKNFKIVCRLDLSDNFYSIIINFQGWDTEIFNFLINYNKDFKVIDCLETSYDEIAESSSGTYSIIDKKMINRTTWQYLSDKTIKNTIFEITDNGYFKEITASK